MHNFAQPKGEIGHDMDGRDHLKHRQLRNWGQGMVKKLYGKGVLGEELNKLVVAVVETSAYRAMIEKSGSVPVSSSPTQMQAVIDAAVRDAAPIITEFGLQVD